jgi:hypothetical protein
MDSVTDSLVRVARVPEPALLRLAPDGTPRLRAAAPGFDALVKLGFDQVRRDGAAHPSFAVRPLQMLAGLRELGGPRAQEMIVVDWIFGTENRLVFAGASAAIESSGIDPQGKQFGDLVDALGFDRSRSMVDSKELFLRPEPSPIGLSRDRSSRWQTISALLSAPFRRQRS